jgi:hypothetical protein
MRAAVRATFATWALLALLGCSVFGVPAPETFSERLAVGYATVTTARNTAATLVSEGSLSAEDGENVLEQTDNARAGLDIARKISATDPDGANARLTSILVGLEALQAYLRSRE